MDMSDIRILGLGQNPLAELSVPSCELPYSPELAQKAAKIIEFGAPLFNELCELVPEDENFSKMKEIFSACLKHGTESRKDLALTRVGWVSVGEVIREMYDLVPENASVSLIERYSNLLDAIDDYNKDFVRRRIVIHLEGNQYDINSIDEELRDEIIEISEEFSEKLAQKYGYTRGVTNCCEKVGYNPPEDSGLRPVHDFTDHIKEDPKGRMRASLDEMMAMIERMGGL